MEILRAIHGFNFGYPIIIGFVVWLLWSLFLIFRPQIPRAFNLYTNLLWIVVGINALAGIILALSGNRVPIATPGPAEGLSSVCGSGVNCLPLDPSRNWEHAMYGGFLILSLAAASLFYRGTLIDRRTGARWMWLVALFAAGVAFRAGQVAFTPGATPGT
ncbi:heme A synthase [Deinobacterium chartae]|uniref:Heme A synthase n=1 Tax=Deinobacterium chartae TaxID=521158 RepID=A0A841I4E1_9DEIO|nr:hypothetical protein [Deinobacterium chartae]MBB6099280.1 heme A synthase [Deinobacterium chartae]